MTEKHHALLGQILAAIENDSLVLPTLPDVAIKLQELIDNPNASADQIVLTLTSDPFISAQLIKSANGAAFADKRPVDNVRGAISRLGYRQVRNLVMAITMNKMFSARNPLINRQMKTVWEHSRAVAAVGYVLAARQPYLSPDQAMLGGLVHRIGVLPLCLHIEKQQLQLAEEALQELLLQCSAIIGTKLLQKWNFPSELVAVVGEYENLQRDSANPSRADYTDVITISSLLHRSREEDICWEQVSAAGRLGLTVEDCQTFTERNAARIAAVAEMLGITPAKPTQADQPASPSRSSAPTESDTPTPASSGILSALRTWLSALWKR